MRIFVAGLSKSGKTTRALHAADRLPALQYISISQLLRSSGGILPVTTLAEGLANQEIAAGVLSAHPRSGTDEIIDGHVLIETMAGPLLVPDAFFDAISPDLLINIQDDPHLIAQRRHSGVGSVEEIAALAALEQAACERAAARLRIPLLKLNAPTLESFSKALEGFLIATQ